MSIFPGIVPLRDDPLLSIPATTIPTYHGGRVLTAVEVYTIFWGTGWQQAPQNGLIRQLNNFFDFILTSPLMDLLREYSVPGQTIGYGRRVGTKLITTSEPGTVQPGGGRLVTDAQIKTALQNWINSSNPNDSIPQPNNNTLYFVYLPPNVTSQAGNQSSCVGGGFCGYHGQINGIIFYGVMPFCTNCASGSNQPLDSLTEVSSHELCEAITNPSAMGWNDDNRAYGEIGDICRAMPSADTRLGGYNVQREWSNRYNACRIAPAPLGRFEGHELTGYVWLDGSQQDLFYLSLADSHVHWLWWLPTTGWQYGGDLTALTGAPGASPDSALSSYVWPDGSSQHVFYVGTDNRVHELYWLATDGNWRPGGGDLLTAQAGAPNARTTALTSSVFLNPSQQNLPEQDVFYLGADSHVHWLWWLPTTGWQYGGDLTALTGAPGASPDSVLSSYVWPDDSSEHVFYAGIDGHVHELYWLATDGNWRPGGSDLLTAQAGVPNARATALSSAVWPDGSQQDLFYLSLADSHVHWLWWLPTIGWQYGGDLTALTGAPGASPDSVLSSYIWPDGNGRYVFYLNAAGHVRVLLWSPAFGWSDTGDLTAQAGTPSARASVLGSYVWPDSSSQHVFYRGDDSHVYELWWLPNPIHASTLAVGLDIQVQPCPPPLNRAVSVMVSAKDEATGLPVDGEVIIVSPTDNRRTIERTNRTFTYRFTSRTVGRGGNRQTFYPTGSVVAPGYATIELDFCFPLGA